VTTNLKKPPDSPTGNIEEWRRRRQEWVNESWAPYLNGSAHVNEVVHDNSVEPDGDRGREDKDETATDEGEIEGKLRPLVPEGERVMVCVDYKVVSTRFGKKDYLYWREERSSPILEQFFVHYEKYPVNSKAVENYLLAVGERPKRLDRISFRGFIGLKAEVFIETVKPTYATGALKGRPKPEALHYSKVSEILRSLNYVDANTLRELRGEIL
jgi:hypothetical protein